MLFDIIAINLDRNRAAIADLAFRLRGTMPAIRQTKYYPVVDWRS
jgi:hypothetical protein